LRRVLSGWEHRMWTDHDNEQLVADQFPQYLSAFQSIRRGVVKADIARYVYLFAYGGFYMDTDYKVVRPIGEEILRHPCVLPVSRQSDSLFRLGNAVMGSEPGHRFWADFLERIFSQVGLDSLAESNIEKTTGPEGLTDFYLSRRDCYRDVFLPPRRIFHPPLTYGGFSFKNEAETVGAHLCWGSWRTKNLLGNVRRLAARKITSC